METRQTSDVETEVNQPGLGELRSAVANRLHLPGRASLGRDGLAGLNVAIANVPDGMASGILAGVNPIHGLYACMMGPFAGSIFSSTRLMIISTTSAASLSAGQALAGLSGEARYNALFLMVLLIGALQVLFGLLRWGRFTRFVSYSVMTGFIIGVAILTVLSQLPIITGYEQAEGENRIAQTADLLANLDKVDASSVAMAGLTLALALTLPRTKLGNFGRLLAIVIPSALVPLLQLDSVQVVRDVGEIPRGIPERYLPSLSDVSLEVITGALAVATIILVQGSGVSQSVPNPDGSRRSMSRDFIAQGAANVASGFFRGLPVGGSLRTTAMNLLSGARTRWAAIFAGLWMALIVTALPGLVAYVTMPALGMLLIIASVSTIKPLEALSIWRTGWPSRLAGVTTLLATLFLPVQAAVGIGVVLSAMLHLNESSTDVSVVELVERPGGLIEERESPRRLPSNEVTLLDVYGHLFFAGARTLERLLPNPQDAHNPVVILRLRGRATFGATLIDVLTNYANKLRAAGGRLYLTGISDEAYDQVVRTGKLRLTGPVRAYEATPVRGQSTREALADARTWLVSHGETASSDGAPSDEEGGHR